jgi:4-amino-4-deoxy-L-arabinose transferase-like glycosyltransferase
MEPLDANTSARSTCRLEIRHGLVLIAILAISFCLRLSFVREPFERDEGLYAYIAQEILRGGVPYKDAIEIKPPAIYYLYAAGMMIFGESPTAIRIFTSFYSLLTVSAIFLLTRQISGRKAGLIAALLHGIFSSSPLLQGSSSNTEVFMLPPLVLGIHFLLRAMDKGERKFIFFCGLCCAAAMLVKSVAIPFVALAAMGTLLVPRPDNTIREKATDIATLALGPAILATLTVGYFFLNGATDDFLYWTIIFPRLYLSGMIQGPPFLWTALFLFPEFIALAIAATPTFIRLMFKVRGRRECIAALTLPAALIAAILPGKHFPHYFILVVPPLAMLAGIEIAMLFGSKRRRLGFEGLLLTAAFSFWVFMRYEIYLLHSPNRISELKYGPVFVQSLEVARYLKERTLPSDYIFQWGLQMELYYLTSRRSPVPFTASLFVGWSKDPSDAARRLVQGINEKKPKYIVFQEQWGYVPGAEEIIEILSRDYFLEATVAYAKIYRRK